MASTFVSTPYLTENEIGLSYCEIKYDADFEQQTHKRQDNLTRTCQKYTCKENFQPFCQIYRTIKDYFRK